MSRNRKITKFFEGVTENEKCLETGKWQNPLVVLKTWLTRGPNWPFRCLDKECLETGETTKYLEQAIFFQGILLFLMFLDIFCNKKCLETGETPKYLEQAIFFKGYCCFSCFRHFFVIKSVQKQENPSKIMIFSKDVVVFPVSWHFWKVKVSGNRETPKSLEYGKCPETGKRQNPLNTESVWKQGNSKILWTRKSV